MDWALWRWFHSVTLAPRIKLSSIEHIWDSWGSGPSSFSYSCAWWAQLLLVAGFCCVVHHSLRGSRHGRNVQITRRVCLCVFSSCMLIDLGTSQTSLFPLPDFTDKHPCPSAHLAVCYPFVPWCCLQILPHPLALTADVDPCVPCFVFSDLHLTLRSPLEPCAVLLSVTPLRRACGPHGGNLVQAP